MCSSARSSSGSTTRPVCGSHGRVHRGLEDRIRGAVRGGVSGTGGLPGVVLQRINPFLMKWATRKYKRLGRAKGKTHRKLAEIASTFPAMSAHWRHGAMPTGSTVGAV